MIRRDDRAFRMIAGAILLLGAAILFCKYADLTFSFRRGTEQGSYVLLVLSLAFAVVGGILLILGMAGKGDDDERMGPE